MSRPRRPLVLALLLAALVALPFGTPAVPTAGAAEGPPAGAVRATSDEAPTGPGVVEGVVRDRFGAPKAGILVSLDTWVTPAGSSDSRWYPRSLTTRADGRYRFDGVPTPDGEVFVTDVRTWAEGYAPGAVKGISARLRAAPATPIVADVVVRRRDVTLRGRVSVRGGSPEGAEVTLTPADDGADPDEGWIARVDEDGRWEQEVPAGRYRITAESTFGLRTSWPDVPASRPGPAPATPYVVPGGVLGGLDVSMRLRMPGPAIDEYGQYHRGSDPEASGFPGRYPRDPYRSVTALRGGVATVGTPVSTYSLGLPRLPRGDLITVTGRGILGLEVPVTNTGDDVLWLTPRLEGDLDPSSYCQWAITGARCSEEQPLLPGETRTVMISPVTTAWAPSYAVTLVLRDPDGLDVRVPMRLRNVGEERFGADDHRNMRGVHPYLSDEDQATTAGFLGLGPPLPPEVQAWMAAMAAGPAPPVAAAPPAPVRRVTPPGVLTLARTSVRFTFPAAGRVDVRIDRLVRAKRERQPDRWVLARTVALKATRPGARSVRIERLAVGPYRVRIVARVGGKVRRVTDYRDVKP